MRTIEGNATVTVINKRLTDEFKIVMLCNVVLADGSLACDGVAFDFVSVFTGQAAVYRRPVNLLWHKNNLRISVWCDTSNQKDEGFCFIYVENTIKPHDHQGKRLSPYFLFLT